MGVAEVVEAVGTAIEPTFRSVGVLAGIVLIRTFLSFSLEGELENRWPWQRPRTAAERSTQERG